MNELKNIPDYLLILQINDALFPIGSYTQSYGLETYVQKQTINDVYTLKKYLVQNLEINLLYSDILAVKLGYEAAQSHELDHVIELDSILSATKAALETRSASIKLSSRFIKTISAFNLEFKNEIFNQYINLVNENKCLGHYALTYGILCGALNLDKSSAILHFSYAQASGIINNGVKLIPLSQTSGQVLLRDMQVHINSVVLKVEYLTIDDLGRTAPGFELRSMQHETLYSRLYMS